MNQQRIVVCDSQLGVRTLLVDFLNKQGYQAYGTSSLQSCLDLVKKLAPSLVLMEAEMPALSGCTPEMIRKVESTVPVLLVSGMVTKSSKVKEILGKVVEVMMKQSRRMPLPYLN